MSLRTYWVCVAHRWAVPPVECGAHGDTYATADRHTRETGHPIVTTTRRELTERLASPITEKANT